MPYLVDASPPVKQDRSKKKLPLHLSAGWRLIQMVQKSLNWSETTESTGIWTELPDNSAGVKSDMLCLPCKDIVGLDVQASGSTFPKNQATIPGLVRSFEQSSTLKRPQAKQSMTLSKVVSYQARQIMGTRNRSGPWQAQILPVRQISKSVYYFWTFTISNYQQILITISTVAGSNKHQAHHTTRAISSRRLTGCTSFPQLNVYEVSEADLWRLRAQDPWDMFFGTGASSIFGEAASLQFFSFLSLPRVIDRSSRVVTQSQFYHTSDVSPIIKPHGEITDALFTNQLERSSVRRLVDLQNIWITSPLECLWPAGGSVQSKAWMLGFSWKWNCFAQSSSDSRSHAKGCMQFMVSVLGVAVASFNVELIQTQWRHY